MAHERFHEESVTRIEPDRTRERSEGDALDSAVLKYHQNTNIWKNGVHVLGTDLELMPRWSDLMLMKLMVAKYLYTNIIL